MASNAIVLVNVVVQTSHPLCAAALPNPIQGIQIEGFFSAFVDAGSVFPVFEAPRRAGRRPLHPSTLIWRPEPCRPWILRGAAAQSLQ